MKARRASIYISLQISFPFRRNYNCNVHFPCAQPAHVGWGPRSPHGGADWRASQPNSRLTKGAFAAASSARILPSFGSQQRWIGPRSHSAPSADDADCADGIFGACTHPDHYPHPAFTPERDLDAHRRRRPASARGLFVPGVPLENSSRAVSAHKRNRSDALPVHIVQLAIIVRTQVAMGSASMMLSMAARRFEV